MEKQKGPGRAFGDPAENHISIMETTSCFKHIQDILNKSPSSRKLTNKDQDISFVGIFRNNKLAGFVGVRKWHIRLYEIRSLYVNPKYRKEGLATKLLEYVVNNYPGKIVGFTTPDNYGSIRTFTKNGFTKLNFGTTLALVRRTDGKNSLRGEVFYKTTIQESNILHTSNK